MPYVERNNGGSIIALHRDQITPTCEYISATAPEVIDFLTHENDADTPMYALAESDRELARVTEDLIHLLVAKNVILFTELPEPVQRKLLTRKRLRSSLHHSIENFLDEEDTI